MFLTHIRNNGHVEVETTSLCASTTLCYLQLYSHVSSFLGNVIVVFRVFARLRVVRIITKSLYLVFYFYFLVPVGSPSRGWDVTVYVWHKPTELAHSFLFSSCVYFCLYGTFNCISFYKFSRQLFAFLLCSSGLLSALLVLSALCLSLWKSHSALV